MLTFDKLPLVKLSILLGLTIIIANNYTLPAITNLSFLLLGFFCILSFLISEYYRWSLWSTLFCLSFYSIHICFKIQKSEFQYVDQRISTENIRHLIITIKELTKKDNKVKAVCEVSYAGSHYDSLMKSSSKILVYFKYKEANKIIHRDRFYTSKKIYRINKNLNPSTFDYQQFMARKSIYHQVVLNDGDFMKIKPDQNISLKSISNKLRRIAQDIIDKSITDENSGAIISAMTLGQKDRLTKELNQAFINSGSVHVLAVSGLHVGIIGGLGFFLINFFNFKNSLLKLIRIPILLCWIWTFVFVTGSAPSSIRAGIMFSLFFIARQYSLATNLYNILAFAGAIMLLINPMELYNIGFQFSFLALISIVFFYPYILNIYIPKNRIIRYVWQLMVVSLSAQILVLPLSIFYFNQIPSYFVISGIITAPFAGIIIIATVVLIIAQLLVSPSILVELLSKSLEHFVQLFYSCIYKIDALPGSVIHSIDISYYSLFLLYLAIVSISIYLTARRPVYLFIGILLLNFQAVIHIIEKRQKWSQKKLIVYDIPRQSQIDLFYYGHLIELKSDTLQHNSKEYNCTPYRNKYYLKVNDDLDFDNIETESGFYRIDSTILLLYPNEEVTNYKYSYSLDYLILNKETLVNLDKLIAAFQVEKIILDSSIRYLPKKIKTNLKNYGISYYWITNQGPFITHIS